MGFMTGFAEAFNAQIKAGQEERREEELEKRRLKMNLALTEHKADLEDRREQKKVLGKVKGIIDSQNVYDDSPELRGMLYNEIYNKGRSVDDVFNDVTKQRFVLPKISSEAPSSPTDNTASAFSMDMPDTDAPIKTVEQRMEEMDDSSLPNLDGPVTPSLGDDDLTAATPTASIEKEATTVESGSASPYSDLVSGKSFTGKSNIPKYTIIPAPKEMELQYVITKDNEFISFDTSTSKGLKNYKAAIKDGGVATKAPTASTVLKARGLGGDNKPNLKTLYNPEDGTYRTFDLSQADDLAAARTAISSGSVEKSVPAKMDTNTTFDLGKLDSWGKAAAAMADANRRINNGEELPDTYIQELEGLLKKFEDDKKKSSNWEKVDMISLKLPDSNEVFYFDLNNKADRVTFDSYRQKPGAVVAKIPTADLANIGGKNKYNTEGYTQAVAIVQDPNASAEDKAEAQKTIAAVTTATAAKEAAKTNASGSGAKVAKYVDGVLTIAPDVRATTSVGANGVETGFVDVNTNKPAEGQYRVVADDAVKSARKVGTELGSEFKEYQGRVTSTKTAVRLGGEILQITTKTPAAKTKMASILGTIKSAGREATTLISATEQLLKSKGGSVTETELNAHLRAKGLLAEGEDLNGLSAFNLGGGLDEIANDNRRLQAKLILMGFRVGGLEGQTGNALSNKDFERLSTVINSSPATFEANLVDYIQGHVDTAVDARDSILKSTKYQSHMEMYQVQPFAIDKVTTDFDNLRVWNPQDKRLSEGMLYTIGVRIDDSLLNNVVLPEAQKQALQQYRGKYVRIVMDEKTQKPKLRIVGE